MAILDKEVIICVNPKSYTLFESKGYILKKNINRSGDLCYTSGQLLIIKIEDLQLYSRTEVNTQCDTCGKIEIRKYCNINTYKSKSGFLATGKLECNVCAMKLSGKRSIGRDNYYNRGKNTKNYIHGSKGYGIYKTSAKRFNILFELSLEQFKEITTKPCHYCNNFYNYKNDNRKCGIDKINPLNGYVIENCLPCCWTCNSMKNKTSYTDFLLKIKQIYNHLQLEKL